MKPRRRQLVERRTKPKRARALEKAQFDKMGLVERYGALTSCRDDIFAAYKSLFDVFKSGGKLLVCGNGGSAADSEHIVGELMKGFLKKRPIDVDMLSRLKRTNGAGAEQIGTRLQGALPAIALTSQVSLNTAISNDTGADMVFAQQVYGLGRKGDALLGISTSGNSVNVLDAFVVAKALDIRTIALTGRSGGRLGTLADIAIRVPADGVAQIQELHLPVYHALCIALESSFFHS